MKRLFRFANTISRRSLAAVTIFSFLVFLLGSTASMQDGSDAAARKRPTPVAGGSFRKIPLKLEPVTDAPEACMNVLVDGGFETGGIPNTFWNPETSTNFGTPLCDVPSCGTGGGASPPRTGAFWTWFGGIPAPETATLGQTVTLPVGQARLVFWMRVGTVSSPFTDVLNVRVDGAIVQSFPEPTVAEGAYTQRIINLNAFANGASHAILFEYIGPTTGTGSYVVDDVAVNVCDTVTAAMVPVSGKVTTAGGSPVGRVRVTLLDTMSGDLRTEQTRGDGSYTFEDVPVGTFYVITAARKGYTFTPDTHSFDLTDQLSNLDFTASH
jgi:hypothetical protein